MLWDARLTTRHLLTARFAGPLPKAYVVECEPGVAEILRRGRRGRLLVALKNCIVRG